MQPHKPRNLFQLDKHNPLYMMHKEKVPRASLLNVLEFKFHSTILLTQCIVLLLLITRKCAIEVLYVRCPYLYVIICSKYHTHCSSKGPASFLLIKKKKAIQNGMESWTPRSISFQYAAKSLNMYSKTKCLWLIAHAQGRCLPGNLKDRYGKKSWLNFIYLGKEAFFLEGHIYSLKIMGKSSP